MYLIFFYRLVEKCFKIILDFDERMINICSCFSWKSMMAIKNFWKMKEKFWVYLIWPWRLMNVTFCHAWYFSMGLLKNVCNVILTFEALLNWDWVASFFFFSFFFLSFFRIPHVEELETLISRGEVGEFNLEYLNLTYLV